MKQWESQEKEEYGGPSAEDSLLSSIHFIYLFYLGLLFCQSGDFMLALKDISTVSAKQLMSSNVFSFTISTSVNAVPLFILCWCSQI